MDRNGAPMVDNKPVQRTSARSLVIAAVVLLIVIAIAGIVLAGRHTAGPVPGTAAAVPVAPVVTTPQAGGATTPAAANEVMFAAGSDKIPAGANEQIAKFGEGARGVGGVARITARYLTGADKARDLELAKGRTAAVRHALEADGVKAGSLQIELVEMPPGVLSERDVNRVELSVR
ncbi:MAG: hypothetical protein ABI281_14475 [Caldimonas sp.]